MARKSLRTPICDMLGIEYPILLAGMGNGSGPQLAAAVANAGGLGMLGASVLEPEEIRAWIRQTRKLTDKPFGVDILMPEAVPEKGTAEELKKMLPNEHVEFMAKMRRELGTPDTKGRQLPLTEEFVRSQFDVVVEEGVKYFATGLGIPDWVESEAHKAGMIILSLVGNVRGAKKVAERGADIIVAQGHEAGGHTGRIGTMALIPQVVDAVGDIPVVAAGGIGDGRGLAASLALGAQGAWVGTAFLSTSEAFIDFVDVGYFDEPTTRHFRNRIIAADEEEARIFRINTGKTARALRNKFSDLWEKHGMPTLPMPLQWTLVCDFQHGMMTKGDPDYSPIFAGQISGLLKKEKKAADLFKEMVDDAAQILQKNAAFAG